MFARWVSSVQWAGGTRVSAKLAVWREVKGIVVVVEEEVYGERVRDWVKKVELRVVKSAALV